MRMSDNPKTMNDDINVMIAEAKIRLGITDREVGEAVGLTKNSLRNYRHNHTLPNIPFWKVVSLAKLAGYAITFEKEGE